jgi:hypothetical protein
VIACNDGRPLLEQVGHATAVRFAEHGAGREEFHDLDDVRFLLRYLNITSVEEALEIVTRYFDAERLPPKTRVALEELLPG